MVAGRDEKKGMECLNGRIRGTQKRDTHSRFDDRTYKTYPALMQAGGVDGNKTKKMEKEKFMRKTFHTLPIIIILLILYHNSLKVEIQYMK